MNAISMKVPSARHHGGNNGNIAFMEGLLVLLQKRDGRNADCRLAVHAPCAVGLQKLTRGVAIVPAGTSI